jgi:hypothetical protein
MITVTRSKLEPVRYRVRHQMSDRMWVKLPFQLRGRIPLRIRDQIWVQVWDQVWDQVRIQVYDNYNQK